MPLPIMGETIEVDQLKQDIEQAVLSVFQDVQDSLQTICRLNIGYEGTAAGRSHPLFFPTQDMADKIQTLHILVNLANRITLGSSLELKSFKKFAGSRIRRRLCLVVFECFPQYPKMASRKPLEIINIYTDFERVVVKIAAHTETSLR